MKWYSLGLYDALDSTVPVWLVPPVWPECEEATKRFRLIIETYHKQNDRQPNVIFPCVSLFEVPEPSELEQLQAFNLLGLPLNQLPYMQKQNAHEPST